MSKRSWLQLLAYPDISRATIDRIEKLAASSPVFQSIDRRCESFIQITS